MIVTKTEFAAALNVTKGRVSQLLRDRIITGAAIVGEGRNARINVDIAKRQIVAHRDPGQAAGNGRRTNLKIEAPAPAPNLFPLEDLPTLIASTVTYFGGDMRLAYAVADSLRHDLRDLSDLAEEAKMRMKADQELDSVEYWSRCAKYEELDEPIDLDAWRAWSAAIDAEV